jgi:hypothetical protein
MPRKYVRKTRRKTRLTKLGVGLAADLPCPDIDLDDSKWESVQIAYGVALSMRLRSSILEVLNEYLRQDQTEAHAPYLRDALAAIERIRKSTDAFVKSINAISDPAGKYALSIVNSCVKRAPALQPSLAAYSVACAEAAKRLRRASDNCGLKEGEAWRSMIWKLLDIAEKSGLPSTVAKPNTRQKTAFRPSPFVNFVQSLQNQLPSVNWNPPRTIGALATAIDLVRSYRAKNRRHLPQSVGAGAIRVALAWGAH